MKSTGREACRDGEQERLGITDCGLASQFQAITYGLHCCNMARRVSFATIIFALSSERSRARFRLGRPRIFDCRLGIGRETPTHHQTTTEAHGAWFSGTSYTGYRSQARTRLSVARSWRALLRVSAQGHSHFGIVALRGDVRKLDQAGCVMAKI